MADEDEIDVLGDFSLDNLLSKSEAGISSCYDNSVLSSQNTELLSCDYSLHSQWLLENPATNSDCWYTSSGNVFNTEDGNSETNTSLGFDEVICTENKTSDESGWTEEEKISLIKGLEIFGKNSVHLSQFIGSKTSSQVKHYLKHYHTKSNVSPSYAFNNIYNTVEINDKQSQTVKNISDSQANELPSVFKMSDIIEDAQIPASIEEVIAAVSTAKPTVQNVACKKTVNMKTKIGKHEPAKKGKFLQKSLLLNFPKKKISRPKTPTKNQRFVEKKRVRTEKTFPKPEMLTENDAKSESFGLILPVSSGEEVIKIKKENSESESDTEIEIDVSEDDKEPIKTELEETPVKPKSEEIITEITENNNVEDDNRDSSATESIPKINRTELLSQRLKTVNETVMKILTSTEVPSEECVLKEEEISELEKCIHAEFFEGRPTKTPSRYLKIRNHIIECWLENKPLYCTKTSVRQGLKNCGDVNCIGRIHQYLEQIGAINFSCEQTNYIRPLINMIAVSQPREKSVVIPQQKIEISRPRMKRKYINDGEGGYTMMHDENGEIIDTTVVNQDKQIKPRTNRRQNIKLVYCKTFTEENPAPYTVELHISALLLIDFHAHSALIEVMGLLGGTFDQNSRVLHITRYIPCRGTDHSNTHCDMCPVSQSEASEVLHSEGIEVVGWFHSHPTFYPNPSLQDIDTQLNMQMYLSNDYKPFVGVILSPFRAIANALVSEYRCLIVDKEENGKEGGGTPYKFQIKLTSSFLNTNLFLKHADEMFCKENNIPKEFVVNFEKPYLHDTTITYLEKLLASVKLHLARCSEINKMTCDVIVQGITEICLRNI